MKHKTLLFGTLLLSLLITLLCGVSCQSNPGSTETDAATDPVGTAPDTPSETVSEAIPAETESTVPEETTVEETETEAATDYVPDFTPTAIPAANVAREGFVLTSSVKFTIEGTYSNTNLNDGDLATGYRSDPAIAYPRDSGEFIFIDLTEKRVIDSLKLYPWSGDEAGFPVDFDVLISDDGTNYTAHKTVTGATPDATGYAVDMGGVEAKYIKLAWKTVGSAGYISLGEFEVYSPIDTASNMQVNIDDIWLFKDPDTTHRLAVTYYRDGTPVDASKLTFVSGNPAVVTVSEDGLLTPVAYGKTKVYVLDGTNMKACDVEVKREPDADDFLISTFFITGYVTPEALEKSIDLTVKSGVTHLEVPHIWDICYNEINLYALHLCNERGAIYTPAEQNDIPLGMTDEQYRALLKPFEGMAGFLGIFISDEPAETYTDFAEIYHVLQTYNPHYVHHMNLFPPAGLFSGPRDYYSEFAAIAGGDYRMRYLTFDQYPFGNGNAFDTGIFTSLDYVRRAGLLYNADTGLYLQNIVCDAFDMMTDGERWYNASIAMAYGIKNYKHYIGLSPINSDGSRTDVVSGILKPDYTPADYYDNLTEINAYIMRAGKLLANSDAMEVYHTRSNNSDAVPADFFLSATKGHLIFSVFEEIGGTRQSVLLTSKNYNAKNAMEINFVINRDVGEVKVYDPMTGETTPLAYTVGEAFTLTFEPGRCLLLILDEGVDVRAQKVESDNLMLDKGMFVSSSQANFYKPDNLASHFVTDGDRNNGYWLSKASDKNPTLLLDLGEVQSSLGRVVIFMNDKTPDKHYYFTSFTVSYSTDGKTYTELTTVTNATYENADRSFTVDLGGIDARYIRISGESNIPVCVGEIEVYKK